MPTPEVLIRRDAKPAVAILREEGSNGDREMTSAFHHAGFEPWDVTMSDLLGGSVTLDGFKGIAFVGGFSYADVLDSAKGWAGTIRFNRDLFTAFEHFYEREDTFSLGVCNGCQLMALLGWVPWRGLPDVRQPRFIHNLSGRFESRFATVKILPDRLKTGENHAIIRSFMVHHQGMIMLSLCNYLLNKRMIRRFHADPRIGSIDLLLREQTPTHAPTQYPRRQQMDTTRGTYTAISLDSWNVSPNAPYKQVHCLSNGKYSLIITAAGSGFSRWNDLELTRWRDDPTLDDCGSWIYVEDRLNGRLCS